MAVLDVFLPFQNEWAVFWASALFVAFVVLSGLFSLVGPFKAKPMLAAHHLVMVFPFAWLSYQGAVHWNSSSKLVPDDASSRLFFQVESAACFAPTMLGLQVFDLSTTLLVPGLGKADAIAHHAIALLLAYQLTSTAFLHYWEPFYFGILEMSSVPLCFVDLLRCFPKLAKRLDGPNEFVRMSFAATFLSIRCLYMPYISAFWWRDFISLYSAGDKKMMENQALFISFGFINVFLCGIQQFWGFKIVTAAIKMAKGDKSGRDKEV